MSDDLVAGIDIGTTSVKVVIVDGDRREILGACSLQTGAGVPSDQPGIGLGASEQDPGRIISTLQNCLLQIPPELLARVKRIGVSGQMHGVVLWKTGCGWKSGDTPGLFFIGNCVSRLYTWQDGRCSEEFLNSLPKPESHLRIASGFGCTTLFWLNRSNSEFLRKFDCAGTIQDFVVSMLCGLERPLMSTQNAASWGYFDTEEQCWNEEILSSANFPVHLLPKVKSPGSVVGYTERKWYLIPEGAAVTVALGDLQCSILAKLFTTDANAVVNISTSAQVCLQMPRDFTPQARSDKDSSHNQESVEYFPYFDSQYLAVAASLNGGNVLASFVEMLKNWTAELGADISTEHIWNQLCCDVDEHSYDCHELIIEPTIFGERHKPNSRGVVTNITPFNTSLRSVYRSLCRGIAQNLCSMMPPQMLRDANTNKILGSGSVLVKNNYLRKELEELYKMSIDTEEKDGCDAAFGAALVASDILKLHGGQ